jgi:hypothetical protein
MRARIVFVLLVLAIALIAVPTGSSYGVEHANPNAVANCEANIDKQFDRGLTGHGGKKDGVPSPTNCDHFFNG